MSIPLMTYVDREDKVTFEPVTQSGDFILAKRGFHSRYLLTGKDIDHSFHFANCRLATPLEITAFEKLKLSSPYTKLIH